MPNDETAIILLSGGLDSLVSIKKSAVNIKLGLIFDYGQNAFEYEKNAAQKIADFYGFSLKTVKLDWLKEITNNGLSQNDKMFSPKDINDIDELQKSMKSVWVPNRNALFINIAASYCEAMNIDSIIIGANKEEGKVFKDNSPEFIENCNTLLKSSTNKKIKVVAPLLNMNKNEIVEYALKENVPLQFIYSCYSGKEKHCGVCESCMHLKNALLYNKKEDLLKILF